MSWGVFSFVLALVYVLQIGAGSILGIAYLDPFLALAAVYGLTVQRHDARIAGWIIGLAQDLGGADAIGLHAFTLGLTVLFITKLREAVNLEAWHARGLCVTIAAFPGQFLYLLHVHYWIGGGDASLASLLLAAALYSVVTGVAALVITSLPNVGLRSRRRGYRAYPR